MNDQIGQEIESKKCPLCEQLIELSKFRMHDIGCSRQNYRCKECNQCVAKAEKEEHDASEHKPLVCEHCAFSAPKFKYGQHNEACTMKPKGCDFCEKTINIADWEDHYQKCGSKTYKCSTCEDYVKFMDRQKHDKYGGCQTAIERKRKEDEQKQIEELNRIQKEKEQEHLKKQKEKEKESARRLKQQQDELTQRKQMEQMKAEQDRMQQEAIEQRQREYDKLKQMDLNQPKPVTSNRLKVGASGIGSQNQGKLIPKPSDSSRATPSSYMVPKREEAKQPLVSQFSGTGRQPLVREASGTGQRKNLMPAQQIVQKPGISKPAQGIAQLQRMQDPRTAKIPSINSKLESQLQRPKIDNQVQNQINYVPLRGQKQNEIKNSRPVNQLQNNVDEFDFETAALLEQFYAEDESEFLANQLQNQAFGGSNIPNSYQQNMPPSVRRADSEQYDQLVGGDDMPPARHHRPRVQPPPVIEPPRNSLDHDMVDDFDIDEEFNAPARQVPARDAPVQNNIDDYAFAMDDDQAMIAKAIEESLRSAQHQPPANYNEEAELARILEMSKQMK